MYLISLVKNIVYIDLINFTLSNIASVFDLKKNYFKSYPPLNLLFVGEYTVYWYKIMRISTPNLSLKFEKTMCIREK